MNLYMLKREHHEGQTIYGVFDKESEAWCTQPQLMMKYPNVPLSEYEVVKIEMNKLIEVESN